VVHDGVLNKVFSKKARGISWRLTQTLGELDFADDICLLSHKWSDMQEKLNDLNYESKKIGLHINLAKSEEMRINNKSNNTIILENQTIRKMAAFTYFSNNVSEVGGAIKDVNIRIQKARGAFSRFWKIWQSTHVLKSTKIKIFNSCVKSVLLYGCETWLVRTDIQRKLQSFINWCLRYICRIWWPSHL
jgi:hypothetical protein